MVIFPSLSKLKILENSESGGRLKQGAITWYGANQLVCFDQPGSARRRNKEEKKWKNAKIQETSVKTYLGELTKNVGKAILLSLKLSELSGQIFPLN